MSNENKPSAAAQHLAFRLRLDESSDALEKLARIIDAELVTERENSERMSKRIKTLEEQVGKLLDHCKLEGGECSKCAVIVCPHKDPMHLHHDGCPSCYGDNFGSKHACGNSDCHVSTGIHEGLTFGRGELDDFGFWEIPCERCARAAEQRNNVKFNTYWPFSKWQGNNVNIADFDKLVESAKQAKALEAELKLAKEDEEETAQERNNAKDALSKAFYALGGDKTTLDSGNLYADVPEMARILRENLARVTKERDNCGKVIADIGRILVAQSKRDDLKGPLLEECLKDDKLRTEIEDAYNGFGGPYNIESEKKGKVTT